MSEKKRKTYLVVANALLFALLLAVVPQLAARSTGESHGCCRTNVQGKHFCCDQNSCTCTELDCDGDDDCKPTPQ